MFEQDGTPVHYAVFRLKLPDRGGATSKGSQVTRFTCFCRDFKSKMFDSQPESLWNIITKLYFR